MTEKYLNDSENCKDFSYIDRNLASIKDRMKNAALSAGRDPEDIKLCVAVKSGEADEINYLIRHHGVRLIGENRVQQMLERRLLLEPGEVSVCFIGSLQTNKIRQIIDKVDLIESVDSLHLAREIDRMAKKTGRVMDILVEINSGGEKQKGGVSFDGLYELCREISELSGLRLCGFMTMAPRCERCEEYRGYFAATREASVSVWKRLGMSDSPILSMGMTDSFEYAILEGATHVRVGRGVFAK